MTWGEIDLASKPWVVPADRMKAGHEHRAPLPERPLAILKAVKPEKASPNAIVFPSAKPGMPLSDMVLLMLLRWMTLKEITTHVFRSTFSDWASEVTNFPAKALEMALAHSVGNKVEAA